MLLHPRLTAALCLLILLFAPAAQANAFNLDPSWLDKIYQALLGGQLGFNAAKSASGNLMGVAMGLFGTLAALPTAYFVLRVLFSRGDVLDAMKHLVEMLLTVGVFWMMLSNYQSWVVDPLVGTFKMFESALSGQQNSLSPMATAIGGMVKNVLDAISKSWDAADIPDDTLIFLVHLVIYAVVIGMLIAAGAFIIIIPLIGKVYAAVGIVVGPLFVACGAWEVTRNLFQQWLEFMMRSLFYSVTALAMVGVLSSMTANITLGNQPGTMPSWTAVFTLLIYAAIFAKLVKEIPEINNSLFTGAIRGGSSIAAGLGGNAVAGAMGAFGGGAAGKAMGGMKATGGALGRVGAAAAKAVDGATGGHGGKAIAGAKQAGSALKAAMAEVRVKTGPPKAGDSPPFNFK